METLNSFLERARRSKWFVSVRQLPEEILYATSASEVLTTGSIDWNHLRADRYFVLHMNIAKATRFIRMVS